MGNKPSVDANIKDMDHLKSNKNDRDDNDLSTSCFGLCISKIFNGLLGRNKKNNNLIICNDPLYNDSSTKQLIPFPQNENDEKDKVNKKENDDEYIISEMQIGPSQSVLSFKLTTEQIIEQKESNKVDPEILGPELEPEPEPELEPVSTISEVEPVSESEPESEPELESKLNHDLESESEPEPESESKLDHELKLEPKLELENLPKKITKNDGDESADGKVNVPDDNVSDSNDQVSEFSDETDSEKTKDDNISTKSEICSMSVDESSEDKIVNESISPNKPLLKNTQKNGENIIITELVEMSEYSDKSLNSDNYVDNFNVSEPNDGFQEYQSQEDPESQKFQGFQDQDSQDQYSQNQNFEDQGFADQGSQDQGFADQGSQDQGFVDQGFADQGSQDQGSQDQGSQDYQGLQESTHGIPIDLIDLIKANTLDDHAKEQIIEENLKVITGLEVGEKLCMNEDGALWIDRSIIPSLTRALTWNNKNNTIQQVVETVNSAIEIKDKNPCIKSLLNDNLIKGLINLSMTYNKNMDIKNKLIVLIQNISC